DLFEHLRMLAATQKLPSMSALEVTARQLHQSFSSTRASHQAARDARTGSAWSNHVPVGAEWTKGPDTVPAPQELGSRKKKEAVFPPDFSGDLVLASSIALIRDALLIRECGYAMAGGDVGRMYEVMKVFLFIFAGSSNSKYVGYFLEQICDLEWESTPEQRKATLRGMVVNITGREGHHAGIDILLEHFNRLLE
ncbi:hypothetical protein FB45DRAFT_728835, partial [Roridomyces roridus]